MELGQKKKMKKNTHTNFLPNSEDACVTVCIVCIGSLLYWFSPSSNINRTGYREHKQLVFYMRSSDKRFGFIPAWYSI